MGAKTSYTVKFKSTAASTVRLAAVYKPNASTQFVTLPPDINNPILNTEYSKSLTRVYSHQVNQMVIYSICDIELPPNPLLTDITYLYNETCNQYTATDNGSSITVTWDSYTNTDGDSVKEYKIEYKKIGSLGPYNVVTIPISQLVTHWAGGGTYPSYTATLTTGVTPGSSYEIRFYTILEYKYYTYFPNNTTILNQVTIGPCQVTLSSGGSVSLLEEGSPTLNESGFESLLEE